MSKTIFFSHAFSVSVATQVEEWVHGTGRPWLPPAPHASLPSSVLHRFLCFWSILLSPNVRRVGGGREQGEVTSDVEDPRPALKDGRGVRRELGPHQMFLRGERGEEKSGVRQLWCSHPLRETRGERSVGGGGRAVSWRRGNLMVMQQKLTRVSAQRMKSELQLFKLN